MRILGAVKSLRLQLTKFIPGVSKLNPWQNAAMSLSVLPFRFSIQNLVG